MNTTRKKLNKGQIAVAIICAILVAALGLGIIGGLASNRQFTLATSRLPENFTELSFNTPGYLPKTATAGETASFSYNITNHENATVTYTPVVTITENGTPHILERDEIILKNGESRNVTVRFTITEAGTNYTVTVDLPAQDQAIHFRGRS